MCCAVMDVCCYEVCFTVCCGVMYDVEVAREFHACCLVGHCDVVWCTLTWSVQCGV